MIKTKVQFIFRRKNEKYMLILLPYTLASSQLQYRYVNILCLNYTPENQFEEKYAF